MKKDWRQFQAELQTSLMVANGIKCEAQLELCTLKRRLLEKEEEEKEEEGDEEEEEEDKKEMESDRLQKELGKCRSMVAA